VVAAFLPWFQIAGDGTVVTVDAFRAGLMGLAFFLSACGILMVLALRHGLVENPSAQELPEGRLLLLLGIGVLALALAQLALGSGGAHRPGIGLDLAILAGAVCTWGGRQQVQDDRGLAGLHS
jgi:peptidoglycan/LPS O-acetylase OafA/YrhL